MAIRNWFSRLFGFLAPSPQDELARLMKIAEGMTEEELTADLTHAKVAAFTREVAASLDIEESFVDFVFAESKPSLLGFYCEPIESGWTCYAPDDVDIAYPLWSCNADQTLLIVSQGKVAYAAGSHDGPDCEPVARSSQGLLADLFLRLWEHEIGVEELREFADFASFRFLGDCVQFQEVNNTVQLPEFRELRASFIANIDSRCL